MSVAEEIVALRERVLGDIAAAETTAQLEEVRVAALGKKGSLTGYLRSMGQIPTEERATVGKTVNQAHHEVEAALEERKAALAAAELEASISASAVDVTLPGSRAAAGHAPSHQPHCGRDRRDLPRPGLFHRQRP